MSRNTPRQLRRRKRRIHARLRRRRRTAKATPVFEASNIHYEVADRVGAIGVGGIGMIHQLARRTGLIAAIDRDVHVLKNHLPYHEYYQGRSVVELRNAGTTPHPQGAILKQRVWAAGAGSISGGGSNSGAGGYIDELVQIAINHDPTDPTENRCHRFLAALHDVNYNVLGVVADDGGAAGGGVLTERYVYSPYGQRQVFGHGWRLADLNGDGRVDQLDLDIFDSEYFGLQTDDAQPGDLDADGDTDLDDRNRLSNALGWNHDHDPHLLTPRTRSARVEGAGGGGVQQPFGLCRIGHQGLAHDEETSLITPATAI